MSYHDLHITTEDMERTSISNLPYGMTVSCTRVTGWQVWHEATRALGPQLLAGEYAGSGKGLRLDVGGHIIIDTLSQPTTRRKLSTILSPFAWRHVMTYGIWAYYQNKITHKRMAKRIIFGGYSPVNIMWLQNREGAAAGYLIKDGGYNRHYNSDDKYNP